VACDAYTSKRANLRCVYLWFNETRMAGDRPVATGQDQFAAAALPSGTGDREASRPPAEEVIGLPTHATDAAIKAQASEMLKNAHGDTDRSGRGDEYPVEWIADARDELLDGEGEEEER